MNTLKPRLKNLFFLIYRILFRTINSLVPKKTDQICFSASPDYDDMARGIITAFLQSSTSQSNIVFLISNDAILPKWADHQRITQIKKHSLAGIWTFFRSKYIFYTHGCFTNIKPIKRQIWVNLWHGMPIKKIGRYINPDHTTYAPDFTLSSSPFFSDIIAYCFGLPHSKVLPYGLPRNDVLFFPKNLALRKELAKPDQKIVIWLPTHRQSSTDALKTDGQIADNLFNLPDLEIQKINDALAKAGAIAVLKPHPMTAHCPRNFDLNDYPHIKIIDQAWLAQRHTTLGELLSLSDCLITDASSVIIDYLLLDRPIICHFPDIDAYKATRGFCWEFDPQTYNIPLVESQTALLKSLQKSLKSPENNQPTQAFKTLCHSDTSGFSHRLLSHLGILKK